MKKSKTIKKITGIIAILSTGWSSYVNARSPIFFTDRTLKDVESDDSYMHLR